MDLVALAEQLRTPRTNEEACRTRMQLTARMRNMLDGDDAETLRVLEGLSACPEAVVAEVHKTSFGSGVKLCERAATAEAMPELGEAMDDGVLSGRKVDIVTNRMRGLTPEQKAVVAADVERIVRAGATQSDRDFDATVKRLTDQVRTDLLERFERQRRDTRLRIWTDRSSGMVNLRGVFDPQLGATVVGAIVGEKERRFHGGQLPDTCPVDPIERDEHLNALALGTLLSGDGQRGGDGPDISVLIDARTLLDGSHDDSVLEVSAGGMSFDLPIETIREWACDATITPIVADDMGRLFLGRTRRLANRDQRRALRAMYRTCACCGAPFERCHIHHVDWWECGGHTDIDRLIPICNRCHHLVHNGTLHLHLAADRTLTVTMSDGSTRINAPPPPRVA